MQHAQQRSIAIVGGGFSGAALAYHLLKRGSARLRVTIIERGGALGHGVAYGVSNALFKLNVPAARMSIDPELPADFVEFAGVAETPHAFLARALYGSYVADRVAAMLRVSPAELRLVRGDAARIEPDGVHLADGSHIRADRVVLATGMAARIGDSFGLPKHPRIVDAWDERALQRLPDAGPLLVLGSGLSAMDILGWLDARGHCGHVTVLSRHGLLPRPHAATPGAITLPSELGAPPTNLRALLAWGRNVVRDVEQRGEPWQRAIDALRPHTAAIWQSLTAADRARFIGSVRPYWEVLRHRAPPESLARVRAHCERGQWSVEAGRVLECRPLPAALEVSIRARGGRMRSEQFDAIVRCVGPALRATDAESPLAAALIARGDARLDPVGLGLMTSPDARVLDAQGRPSDRLFALGQPCRASRWETTAVPEIARDASALSQLLLQA